MKHRIGIIGCGWVAPFHVNALANLRGRVEVTWVADPAAERTETVARQIAQEGLGDPRRLRDYREGLGEAASVFILLPHHLHHRATLEALAAGCHVLLEKPLAVSLAEADEMIRAAESAGRLLMVAYPHRYRTTTRAFKQYVESGAYGRLILLDAMMDENLRGYADLGWIREKRTLGGGVFFSASPHMLDVMFWIGGEVATLSMVGNHGGVPMEGETTAVSIMKFRSGAIGTTRHTWVSPAPQVWYTMRAVCENGILTLTANPEGDLVKEGHLCRWRSVIRATPPDRVLLESGEGLDFTGEITHFFDCLETGQPCQTDARSARKLMELVFQAYDKAEREGGN
ncbi:MAG TPA: Gfo/Idh/MocA family oxidoreductase [Bryobacteraceae bacterium]|nr:Gfo/Idh/MocA family oxidoreductase [Bryobacteraceae bacterium]